MSNYHYIIAGLPNIVLDYGSGKKFSYQDVRNSIAENCSAGDTRLIEWLEFGMDEENLSPHTYRAIGKLRNRFLREYFEFDRQLRNAVAVRNSEQLGKDPAAYTIGTNSEDFEERTGIRSIFAKTDLLEKEKAMDRLRWDMANGINTFHYFDMDVILAFLVKASIVERWNRMDAATGTEMFEKLVKEVTGTFKGIDKGE